MDVTRPLDWLGWHREDPAVGVHLSADQLTVCALRSKPLRLVALGREPTADAAVVGDDIRLVGTVAAELGRVAAAVGLAPTAPTVVTIEPSATWVDLGPWPGRSGLESAGCPVRRGAYERAVEAISRSGLRIVRVDTVPASLARLATLLAPGHGLLAGRWLVSTGGGTLSAELVDGRSGWLGMLAGPDPGSMEPLSSLPGLRVPAAIRPHLDLGRDGPAIGAAMAGLGLAPLVRVRPVDAPAGGGWLAQPVDGGRGAPSTTIENWSTT